MSRRSDRGAPGKCSWAHGSGSGWWRPTQPTAVCCSRWCESVRATHASATYASGHVYDGLVEVGDHIAAVLLEAQLVGDGHGGRAGRQRTVTGDPVHEDRLPRRECRDLQAVTPPPGRRVDDEADVGGGVGSRGEVGGRDEFFAFENAEEHR